MSTTLIFHLRKIKEYIAIFTICFALSPTIFLFFCDSDAAVGSNVYCMFLVRRGRRRRRRRKKRKRMMMMIEIGWF
uniref:Transmembrane protein n=1 Tax=Manihot esculenta TaxID=3983 RepID=A0A2C9VER1_MANES